VLGTVNEGATKIVFPYFPFSLLDKVGQFNTIKVKKPHLVTALNKILQELQAFHLVLKRKTGLPQISYCHAILQI